MDHNSNLPPHHQLLQHLRAPLHGESAHMPTRMPITFFVDYKNMELLFADLVIDCAGDVALIFQAVFLLKVGYEDPKRARVELLHKTQQCTPVPGNLLAAAQLQPSGTEGPVCAPGAASYLLLMLIAMTYNAYLSLEGASTCYWLFGGKKAQEMDSLELDWELGAAARDVPGPPGNLCGAQLP
ncbi:high affinity copper uptake protein 1-like [Suncus etruscus]|uniref:high affinity copper uptake protein 1-like n=1 Tax=Suncus etruscus TaxID=109475 RepID=UPI0021101979|nr:high affinity copper uptake protein 1-like [Suncus etruscus]